MAKYCGDIPCVKQNGITHITKCATECLCGKKWSCSRPSNREDFKTENIIWRNLNAVTCEICRKFLFFLMETSWNHHDCSRNYFSC